MKLIIFLVTIIVILMVILGSRATLQSNIPIDAMQDPIPFRQSCDVKVPDSRASDSQSKDL